MSHLKDGLATIIHQKKGLFKTPTKAEDRIDVKLLSLQAAETKLQEGEAGTIFPYINSEPSRSKGRSGHHLFISFKYRRTLIHYEYYWVNLKVLYNQRQQDRSQVVLFQVDHKEAFNNIVELVKVFLPNLQKKWLHAIVKAANFIDQPVESVDLKRDLQVRHHLILTRRTAQTVGVVMCKSDEETKKIVSMGIEFDFKNRRVRNEAGTLNLQGFGEVLREFLGLQSSSFAPHSLEPSPREEDEEDQPFNVGLLGGIQDMTSEKKLRTLLQAQAYVRQVAQERSGQPTQEALQSVELLPTFVLPLLLEKASVSKEERRGSIGGLGIYSAVPFDDIQIIVCDILADLCDWKVEVMGPHIWRLWQGFMEHQTNWIACLAALNILVLMTGKLASWLVHFTDASAYLSGILTTVQRQLSAQREANRPSLDGARSRPPEGPRYPPLSKAEGFHSSSGMTGTMPPPPLDISVKRASPRVGSDSGRAVEATAEGHAASLKPFQRQPSHPSFDELEHDEWGSSMDASGCVMTNSAVPTPNTAAKAPRPVRVPPLNLGLASKPAPASQTISVEGLSSMTRSSRRLRHKSSASSRSDAPFGLAHSSALSGLHSPNTHPPPASQLLLKNAPLGTPGSASASAQRSLTQRMPQEHLMDLTRMLGETCLLNDLSGLVKFKQERQVHEAVKDSMGRTFPCSPARLGLSPSTKSIASTVSTAGGHSRREGGQRMDSGIPPQPTSKTSNTAEAATKVQQLQVLLKVRMHVCLVLRHFCEGDPKGWSRVGPVVPVNLVWDMLQDSNSNSGACSFPLRRGLQDQSAQNEKATGKGLGTGNPIDDGRPRSLLQQKISPCRLKQINSMREQLQKLTVSKRCACCSDGSSSARGPSSVDLCTCIDAVLAPCLWSILGAYAQHVEGLHDTVSPFYQCDILSAEKDGTDSERVFWHNSNNAWNIRNRLDTFLWRLQRALCHAHCQMVGNARQPSATGEAKKILQNRISFLLLLCSEYLDRCATRVSVCQAYNTIAPTLLSIKLQILKADANLMFTTGLPPPLVHIWSAYLQLIGSLMKLAVHFPQAGERMLICLLDFPEGPSITRSPSSARVRNFDQQKRTLNPSHSGGSLAPAPSSLLRAGARSGGPLTPQSPTGDNESRSLKELVPRFLERVLCEEEGAHHRGSTAGRGDDGPESLRCRLLGFIEALLTFAVAGATARRTVPPANDIAGQEAAAAEGHVDASGGGSARGFSREGAGLLAEFGNESHEPAASGKETILTNREAVWGRVLPVVQTMMEWLQFFFRPPAGLLCRIAKHCGTNNMLLLQLLRCEAALFNIPLSESIYMREPVTIDYYIRRHFLAIVRLYNSKLDSKLVQACRLHLQVLLAIACQPTELPRKTFQQLRVIDFLAGEIDLEHDVTQMRERFISNMSHQTVPKKTLSSCLSAPGLLLGSGPIPVPAAKGTVTGIVSQARPRATGAASMPLGPAVEASAAEGGAYSMGSRMLPAPPLAIAIPPQLSPQMVLPSATASAPLMRKGVPKLSFKGLRPSTQGTSGLGFVPPEEPGQDKLSEPQAAVLPGSTPVAPGAAPHTGCPPPLQLTSSASTPALHFPTSQGSPDDDDDSSIESPVRGSSEVPKLSFHALGDCPVPKLPGFPGGQPGVKDSPFNVDVSLNVADSENESLGSSMVQEGVAQRAPPPFVPKLSLSQDTPPVPPWGNDPATLAGISASPSVVEAHVGISSAPSTLAFAGAPGASARRDQPLEAVTGEVIQTPPTTPSWSAGGDQRKLLFSQSPRADLCDADPWSRGPGPVRAVGHIAKTCGPVPGLKGPVGEDRTHSEGDRPGSACSSSDRSSRSSTNTPVGKATFSSQLAHMKKIAVPKLSFGGLRPSLQGCSGLGAPPPEEPVQMLPPQEQAMVMQQAQFIQQEPSAGPLSPPPPSDSDSSPEKPSEKKVEPAIEVDSSDDSADDGIPPSAPPTMSMGFGKVAGPKMAVPKLAFRGLRPSLQGCSGLGAVPPEEPVPPGGPPPSAPSTTAPPPLLMTPQRSDPQPQQPSSQPQVATFAQPHDPQRPFGHHQEVPPLNVSAFGQHQNLAPFGQPVPAPLPLPPSSGLKYTPGTPQPYTPVLESPSPLDLTPTAQGRIVPDQTESDFTSNALINQNVFYFEGRQRRRIYEDLELHSLMLTLILALLVTPKRGLLDERYCDQYPVMHQKLNIPFLLHLHLNHSANRKMLTRLTQQVEMIQSGGGFRLLKLLCETAMHRWMYSDWTRIAGGAFGTVYQCCVQFDNPGRVAIKQIPSPKTISDRCVFYDVFNECACLDTIRFESNVCELFDYGVDESCFWIVMKYYPTTLKKWRESLRGSLSDNLCVLLGVFGQVLKAVSGMHRNGVIHYDLKCDNIMLDAEFLLYDQWHRSLGDMLGEAGGQWMAARIPYIAIGDFGESRVMESREDWCLKNRGTELIKCPEMLEIEKAGRKDHGAFDRRKKVGTDTKADVWSLGCLFFELLTSKYLFENEEWIAFYMRVTGKTHQMLPSDSHDLLERNETLLKFVQFMLVVDPHQRPSIQQVMKKFQNVYATAVQSLKGKRLEEPEVVNPSALATVPDPWESPMSVARSTAGARPGSDQIGGAPSRPLVYAAGGDQTSQLTKILRDLYILEVCDEDSIGPIPGGASMSLEGQRSSEQSWMSLLRQHSWTHVINFRLGSLGCLPQSCNVLQLPWSSSSSIRTPEDFIRFLPLIFDFLRHAAITNGATLLVDGRSAEERATSPGGTGAPCATGRGGMAMAAVLAVVTESLRMDIYRCLSFLSSQLLVAAIRPDVVVSLARWQETMQRGSGPGNAGAWKRQDETVRIACICGSCSWYIPFAWLPPSYKDPSRSSSSVPKSSGRQQASLAECSCTQHSPTADECPNKGHCHNYLEWFRGKFGIDLKQIRWLWLPPSAGDECDGRRFEPTRGLHVCAEAWTPPQQQQQQPQRGIRGETFKSQRYRCRSCNVITHAVISEPGGRERIALVTSYELCRATTRAIFDWLDVDQMGTGGVSSFEDVNSKDGAALVEPWSQSCSLHFHSARLGDFVTPKPRSPRSLKNLL